MAQSLFANLIISISNQKLLQQLISEFPAHLINWNEEIISKKEKTPLHLYFLKNQLSTAKEDDIIFFNNFVENLIKSEQINIYDANFINLLVNKSPILFLKIVNDNKIEYAHKLTAKQKIKLLETNNFDLIKSLTFSGIDFFKDINPLMHTENEQAFRFLLNQNKIDIDKPLFDGNNLIIYLIKEQKLINVINSYIQENQNKNNLFKNGIFDNNIENVITAFFFSRSSLLKRIVEKCSTESVFSFDKIPDYINYLNQKVNKKEFSPNQRNELQRSIQSLRNKGFILFSTLFNNANTSQDIENVFLEHYDEIKKNLLISEDNSESNFYSLVKNIINKEGVDDFKIIDHVIKDKSFSTIINNRDNEFITYLFDSKKDYVKDRGDYIYESLVNSIGMAVSNRQDSLYTTFDSTIELININFPEQGLPKLLNFLGSRKNKSQLFKQMIEENVAEFLQSKKELEIKFPEINKKIFENKSSFLQKNKETKALYESVMIKSNLINIDNQIIVNKKRL